MVKGEIETLVRGLDGRFVEFNKNGVVGFIFSDKALYTLNFVRGVNGARIALKKIYPNKYTTTLYYLISKSAIRYRSKRVADKEIVSKLERIATVDGYRVVGVVQAATTGVGLAVKEEGDHVSIAVVYAYE